MYFDVQISNSITIFVGHDRKPSIIQKPKGFPGLSRVSDVINKKSTFAVQLLIHSNVLLTPAAKTGGIK